jgi:methionine sulfoxide reductase catalytic subunit
MNMIIPRRWNRPDREITPEGVFLNRRRFIQTMGLVGAAGGLLPSACGAQPPDTATTGWASGEEELTAGGLYPAPRSERFQEVEGRPLTEERVAATYNNFYEFTTNKPEVWRLARDFETRPWQVEVAGLVDEPRTWDIDELERDFPLEERVYRLRCVEAWSMVVPWTGFPLRELLRRAQPRPEATHVRFVSVHRPEQMRGQRRETWYHWPYYEALRHDEAMNELALVVTGIYGHRLSPQHGAPVRLIVPWKYGYKSPKSIVRIELVAEQPGTFWNDLQPSEYSFLSNVDPTVPHPRWSQASERVVGSGERIETFPFNGYGEWVADLY